MATGAQFPQGHFIGVDNEDLAVPYGKVYFTDSFTGDPITTFKNSAMTVVNAHPVVLTASGKATIFLDTGTYNITLTDADDMVIWSINDFVPVGLGIDTSAWREDEVASAGQTDFVLAHLVENSNLVYLQGVLLTNVDDYVVLPPNTIRLTTPATLDDNLSFFGAQAQITTSSLYADGSVPMEPTYEPSVEQDIATKKYVDTYIPPAGAHLETYGTLAPDGYLICDGRALEQLDYPELFAVLGSLYDTFGGATAPDPSQFRIPPQENDGKGLFSRGVGATAVGALTVNDNKTHNHTTNSHTHGMTHNHPASFSGNALSNHNHPLNFSYGGTFTAQAGSFFIGITSTTDQSTSNASAGTPSGTVAVSNSAKTATDGSNPSTNSTGGTETVPQSITVLKCISVGRADWFSNLP